MGQAGSSRRERRGGRRQNRLRRFGRAVAQAARRRVGAGDIGTETPGQVVGEAVRNARRRFGRRG
jgi:hypothetical protein